MAQRLHAASRTSDVVARYGGDEFVVLLNNLSASNDVTAAEEKIRSLIEQPIVLAQGTIRVSASLGWAIFPQDGQDVQSLLKAADTRMFEDKKARKAGR